MSKKKVIPTGFNFDALVDLCQQTHEELHSRALRSVDIAMVTRNWLIGWYLVEYEQNGADRAKYGSKFITNLSQQLKRVGIKGISTTQLKLFRSFYLQYRGIRQTLSDKSVKQLSSSSSKIGQTVSDQSPDRHCRNCGTASGWWLKRLSSQDFLTPQTGG